MIYFIVNLSRTYLVKKYEDSFVIWLMPCIAAYCMYSRTILLIPGRNVDNKMDYRNTVFQQILILLLVYTVGLGSFEMSGINDSFRY
jgi:hypothetical protein